MQVKKTSPGHGWKPGSWMGRGWLYMVLLTVFFSWGSSGCDPQASSDMGPLVLYRAGLRASSYGAGTPFPSPSYWVDACDSMASRFEVTEPSVVWIVGIMDSHNGTATGKTILNFPRPGGSPAYRNIYFRDTDENTAYLEAFQQKGIKVWLQVEPGNADVSTLIRLILDRYASYSCVTGFGVDAEWYRWSESTPEGVAVTDARAREWSELVRSYSPSYRLFLKHWKQEKMPPVYREGITFIDDSQRYAGLDQMLTEFEEWGSFFAPAPVAFQYGYEADRGWWEQFSDPPAEIGRAILRRVPNAKELYWVDFTMKQIWP